MNTTLLSSPSYAQVTRSSAMAAISSRKAPDFTLKKDFSTLKSSSFNDSDTASAAKPIYYQFKLDRRTKVKLTLDNQRRFNPFTDLLKAPNLFATVLDDDGRSVQASSKAGPGKSESFTTRSLDEGTYFLKMSISGSRRDVKYALKIRRASSGLFGTGLFS